MSGIQFFSNPQFGQIRTAGTPDNPLFCLADLCRALGLRSPDVKQRLTDDVVSTHTATDALGRQNMLSFVNEDGLYDVILDSRKPEAKAFRKWITSEVLPSIRKHGGYLTKDALAQIIANPESAIEMLSGLAAELRDERQRVQMLEGERNLLQEKVEEMTDKAQYTDDVLQSTETATFEQMSKELNFPSVYKFIERLKGDGIIYKRSDMYMLYAQYCGKGLTATRTYRFYHRDGRPGTNTRTVWTQAGRKWLHERYAG